MNHGAEALRQSARRLLPLGYGCVVLPLTQVAAPLLPQEAAAIQRAIPRRQQEFAVGRMALRAAIREAGHDFPPSQPIAMRPDRAPDLPVSIRASLSHAGKYCIAIAAPPGGASPGVDLAHCADPRPEGLAAAVMPFRMGLDDPLLAFCVKEALFKAQYPLTGRMLDFGDVPAVIGPARFRACLGHRLIGGRWEKAVGYYLAVSLWTG